MGFTRGICLTFLVFCIFTGCSTVKYFTPHNYEQNEGQLSNIYKSSTVIIVNDLRESVDDRTKSVIEQIIMSSLNSSVDNDQKINLTIKIDIIEHRAYFLFVKWNGETILHLVLLDDNNKALTENIIKIEESVFNSWGYKSAEKISQKTFEKAMDEMLNILTKEAVPKLQFLEQLP